MGLASTRVWNVISKSNTSHCKIYFILFVGNINYILLIIPPTHYSYLIEKTVGGRRLYVMNHVDGNSTN